MLESQGFAQIARWAVGDPLGALLFGLAALVVDLAAGYVGLHMLLALWGDLESLHARWENSEMELTPDESTLQSEILIWFNTIMDLCLDDETLGRDDARDVNKTMLAGFVTAKMHQLSTPAVKADTVGKLHLAAVAHNNGIGSAGAAACMISSIDQPEWDDLHDVLGVQIRYFVNAIQQAGDEEGRQENFDLAIGLIVLLELEPDRAGWEEEMRALGFTAQELQEALASKN